MTEAKRPTIAELEAILAAEGQDAVQILPSGEVRHMTSFEDLAMMAENRELRARIDELETENQRLIKAVCSGILGELLTPDETEALVSFVKMLRSEAS